MLSDVGRLIVLCSGAVCITLL